MPLTFVPVCESFTSTRLNKVRRFVGVGDERSSRRTTTPPQ